jgi:circadian clock protein KaiC
MPAAPVAVESAAERDRQPVAVAPRVATGVELLDAVLGGGIPPSRTVLVCGPAGTGKSTLALHFLGRGVQEGERGVLALVDSKPRHVMADARGLGFDLANWIERKQLLMLDASPFFSEMHTETRRLDPRQVAGDLARQIKSFGARRLVIDPVTSLVPEDVESAPSFLRSVLFSLEDNLDCTTVLVAPSSDLRTPMIEQLVSGIVDLGLRRDGNRLQRTLTVRKMRGTPVEPAELNFAIQQRAGIVKGGTHE